MHEGSANELRLTQPMRRVQARIGRPLDEYIREQYEVRTQAEIAAALGVTIGTISKWMARLGIEARFPGQRPEAVA